MLLKAKMVSLSSNDATLFVRRMMAQAILRTSEKDTFVLDGTYQVIRHLLELDDQLAATASRVERR
jgi:hypothetical protein